MRFPVLQSNAASTSAPPARSNAFLGDAWGGVKLLLPPHCHRGSGGRPRVATAMLDPASFGHCKPPRVPICRPNSEVLATLARPAMTKRIDQAEQGSRCPQIIWLQSWRNADDVTVHFDMLGADDTKGDEGRRILSWREIETVKCNSAALLSAACFILAQANLQCRSRRRALPAQT